MLSNFFAPLAVKILSGLSIALALTVAVLVWRVDSISGERDTLQTWQNDVVGVTRAVSGRPKLAADQVPLQIKFLGDGVAKLRDTISGLNRDANLRAAAFEASKAASARDVARLAEAAKVSDARIARLQRLAAQPPGQCQASPELLEALEGL